MADLKARNWRELIKPKTIKIEEESHFNKAIAGIMECCNLVAKANEDECNAADSCAASEVAFSIIGLDIFKKNEISEPQLIQAIFLDIRRETSLDIPIAG